MNSHWVALILVVALSTLSQLFLKQGARYPGSAIRGMLHPYTLLGYALLGLSTPLVVYALQTIELKVLTASQGIQYMAVMILSVIVLKEKLNSKKVIGTAMIIAGVVLFAKFQG